MLGIAWREVALDHPHAVVGDETELVLAGFAAFLDPPKESAASALAALGEAGVAIKIVTGDSDRVTRHVCDQLKIPLTGLLTGKEIAQMDDYALRARVETTNLFCRVNPSQKDRVIRRAQGPWPRGRLSGRWHQRRAVLALGGRRSVGGLGRGRGQGGGRHDPPETRPACASRGRARRTAYLRQHHEVHHDGYQLKLRQHVQHGRCGGVPAVPADAADTDPAQQHSLRHIGSADPARRGGCRGDSPPARTWT